MTTSTTAPAAPGPYTLPEETGGIFDTAGRRIASLEMFVPFTLEGFAEHAATRKLLAASWEMREALRLAVRTSRPFAPAPAGLGLAYCAENLQSSAWATRDAAARAAMVAALEAAGEAEEMLAALREPSGAARGV